MDALNDEVESLEAILMEDVIITKNPESGIVETIETTIFPLVGEDGDQQYVCVTLKVFPTKGYPDESPEFELLRPRGLDDFRLDKIKEACRRKLTDTKGYPVVFDLIEVIREQLSDSNMPSGQCVVCLYGFSEGDSFTRTECYHYLHSYCLHRHITALRKNYNEEFEKLPAWLKKTAESFQPVCPVCREPIKDETESLKCAMPPSELQNAPDFELTQELRELQLRMSKLFFEQKNRGSIIDLEAESACVISIETEQEMRIRLQKKQEEENIASSEISCDKQSNNEPGERSLDNEECSQSRISGPSTSNDVKASKNRSNVNFSPIVDTLHPRSGGEPTNNNYNHFRRHRGGRREHHRHYRQRFERERERYKDQEEDVFGNTNNSENLSDPTTSSQVKPKSNSQFGMSSR